MLAYMACVLPCGSPHTYIFLNGGRREMANIQTIKYALITLAGATGIFIDTLFVVIK